MFTNSYKIKTILALFLFMFLTACSQSVKVKLDFNPTEPLRVAIMPFVGPEDASNLSDTLAADKDNPARFVAGLVYARLKDTMLEVLPTAVVESKLLHSRFARGMSLETREISQASAGEICNILGCDAVMYGHLSAWDQDYYGVESVNRVGVKLRLVAARDNREIYSVDYIDSDSRGLSKGPTGYFSLVFAPVEGLSQTVIEDLARKVVDNVLDPLIIKSQKSDMPLPVVYAAAHDATTGEVKSNQTINILMFGTANLKATFSVGEFAVDVPMYERSPGHYLGRFKPLLTDRFENQDLIVAVRDNLGRSVRYKAGALSLFKR